MEHKLFYQDAYIKNFKTEVNKQNVDEAGKPYIVLNETAFYPGGGGQPCDLGVINNIPVIHVEEVDDEIRHYIETPMAEEVNTVEGKINWSRRHDHMQQHSGQHILSAAFEELFQIKTVGFHMGQEIVTIDLNIEELPRQQVKAVEDRANQIIFENYPIKTKWIQHDEINEYPLRKAPSVTENIRLVIIEEFDYNACGGTHPRTTGEVGLIKVLQWERHRQHIRLSFICGRRILDNMDEKINTLTTAGQLLHSSEKNIPNHIERLIQTSAQLEKQLDETKEHLNQLEAQQLILSAREEDGYDLISHAYRNKSMKELQVLAQQVTQNNQRSVCLFASIDNETLQFVCSKGDGVSINMKQIIDRALPLINGKGGGSPLRIQGGGDATMSADEFIKQLEYIVHSL